MNKEQYKAYLRQRLNEEDSDDAQIDPQIDAQIASHPHGPLTGVLAQHLGADPSEVFEITSQLTADSPQEHVDNAIGDVISEHGDKVWRKLSKEPSDPYYFRPSRYRDRRMKGYIGEYLLGPDDRNEADVASNKQYNRYLGDFTNRINQDVRIGGYYMKFYGKHPPQA